MQQLLDTLVNVCSTKRDKLLLKMPVNCHGIEINLLVISMQGKDGRFVYNLQKKKKIEKLRLTYGHHIP